SSWAGASGDSLALTGVDKKAAASKTAAPKKIRALFRVDRVGRPRGISAPVRGKNSLPKVMVRVVEGLLLVAKVIADASGFGNRAGGFSSRPSSRNSGSTLRPASSEVKHLVARKVLWSLSEKPRTFFAESPERVSSAQAKARAPPPPAPCQ